MKRTYEFTIDFGAAVLCRLPVPPREERRALGKKIPRRDALMHVVFRDFLIALWHAQDLGLITDRESKQLMGLAVLDNRVNA